MNDPKKILIVFDAGSGGDDPLNFIFDADNPHSSVAEICGAIKEAERSLRVLGFRPRLCDIEGSLRKLTECLRKEKPDLIFNLCETVGDDPMGEIHAVCLYEIAGIPYTGSAPYTLAVALNKARSKEILNFYKIPTPNFFVVKNPSEIDSLRLSAASFIIKPVAQDGSIGIDERSLVSDREALRSGVERLNRNLRSAALVEEFIDGREFMVSILGNKKPEILPISEVDFSALPEAYPKILTYDAKWRRDSEAYRGTPIVCPTDIGPDLEKEIKDIAFKVYRLFECRDYARIDFRLNKKGRPYVLEVNPNPDIAPDGGFCKAARAAGFDYPQMLKKIIDAVIERLKEGTE